MARIPHAKHFRHAREGRFRYSDEFLAWVAEQATRLAVTEDEIFALLHGGKTAQEISLIEADPPSNIHPPVVSGGGLVGETLSCNPGSWGGHPLPTFGFQWKRAGANLPGQTTATYVTVQGDYNQAISCTVTATNIHGAVPADSNAVTIGGEPINTVAPVVSGNTVVGQTLTTTNGTWSAYPEITGYDYQWKRGSQNIAGATSNTHVLVANDESFAIQCVVTAKNFFGSTAEPSNAVGPITPPLSAPANTSAPFISGNPIVGQQLSCSQGVWSGNPAPTFAYQWKKDNVDISGSTASTYTPVTEDIGAMITCAVTATNSEGSVAATSNAVGPVTA